MMDTAKEGWGKFLLHFGVWLGVPSLALYIAYKMGAPAPALGPLLLIFIVGVVIFVAREIQSTRRGVQTKGKMAIDLTSKSLGLFLALFTIKWWWKKRK